MPLNTYDREDIKEGLLYLYFGLDGDEFDFYEGEIGTEVGVYRIGKIDDEGFQLLKPGEEDKREAFENLEGILFKPGEDGELTPYFPKDIVDEIASLESDKNKE